MLTPTNPAFDKTRQLLAIWQDAQRLFIRQPTKDNGALAQHAHAEYLTEQTRAIAQATKPA